MTQKRAPTAQKRVHHAQKREHPVLGDEWRALALEAAALDPVRVRAWTRSGSLVVCAFCRATCDPGRAPLHGSGCLVLRAQRLRETTRDYWTIKIDGEADDTLRAVLNQLRAGKDGYMVSVTAGDETVHGQYYGIHDREVVLMETDDTFDTSAPRGERRFPIAAVDIIHVY